MTNKKKEVRFEGTKIISRWNSTRDGQQSKATTKGIIWMEKDKVEMRLHYAEGPRRHVALGRSLGSSHPLRIYGSAIWQTVGYRRKAQLGVDTIASDGTARVVADAVGGANEEEWQAAASDGMWMRRRGRWGCAIVRRRLARRVLVGRDIFVMSRQAIFLESLDDIWYRRHLDHDNRVEWPIVPLQRPSCSVLRHCHREIGLDARIARDLDEWRDGSEGTRRTSLIDARWKGAEVAEVNVKCGLDASLGMIIKEIGHCQFNYVGLRAVDRCSE